MAKTSTNLQHEFPNFTWHVALSDPLPEDNWDGYTGSFTTWFTKTT